MTDDETERKAGDAQPQTVGVGPISVNNGVGTEVTDMLPWGGGQIILIPPTPWGMRRSQTGEQRGKCAAPAA